MMNGWQNGKDKQRERESRFLENIILIIGKKKRVLCCQRFVIVAEIFGFWSLVQGNRVGAAGGHENH